MQLHNLHPAAKQKKKKRVGRGGKRGTYSGRGIKGQKARAGHRIRPALRDVLKSIPKLRGYKFKSFRPKAAPVNLADIEKKFKAGELVSPETLFEKGLIGKIKGRLPRVKILGRGKLSKRIKFKEAALSKSAQKHVLQT